MCYMTWYLTYFSAVWHNIWLKLVFLSCKTCYLAYICISFVLDLIYDLHMYFFVARHDIWLNLCVVWHDIWHILVLCDMISGLHLYSFVLRHDIWLTFVFYVTWYLGYFCVVWHDIWFISVLYYMISSLFLYSFCNRPVSW